MSAIIEKDVPLVIIACNSCRHYNRTDMHSYSCKAFENIPKEILTGYNMHIEPLINQNNTVVYEKE